MPAPITNGESGSSVRSKINASFLEIASVNDPFLQVRQPGDFGEWKDFGERLYSGGEVRAALRKYDAQSALFAGGVPGSLFDFSSPAFMRQNLDGTGVVGAGDPVRWIQDPVSGQVAALVSGSPRTFEVDARGVGYLSSGNGIYRTPTATANMIDLRGRTRVTVVVGCEYDNLPSSGVSVPVDFGAAAAGGFLMQVPSGSAQFWFRARGTVGVNATVTASPNGLNAPNTAVIVGQVDLPSATLSIRANRVQIASDTGTLGTTGEMTRFPLHIGGNASLASPFSGRLRFLAVVGDLLSGQNLDDIERRVQYLCGRIEAPAVSNNLEITVGSGGQFASLSAAMRSIGGRARQWDNSDAVPTIRLLPGFVLAEQINIESYDWSWLDIYADDAFVNVDATAYINKLDDRGSRPAFSVQNGGRLPFIRALFQQSAGPQACGVLLNRGSMGVIADNAGFRNFYDNAIVNNNSELVARFAVLSGATRWCVHARHISRVSARSCNLSNTSSSGTSGAYADRISDIDVRQANLNGNSYGVQAHNGSRIVVLGATARDCSSYSALVQMGSFISGAGAFTGDAGLDTTGTTTPFNQTVNTLTADGAIFSA